MSVPGRGGRSSRPGIRIHRAGPLPPEEVTRKDRIPVTTPARTIADLAGRFGRRSLERVLDEADRLGLCTRSLLQATLDRHPTKSGARLLRAILQEHEIGTTTTRSQLEERFLELCRTSGLPTPDVNAGLGPYVVDFLWRDECVVVETDGHASHGTRAAFERDRARDAHLTAAGFRVLRFTYRQVVERPDRVAAVVGALLASPPARACSPVVLIR